MSRDLRVNDTHRSSIRRHRSGGLSATEPSTIQVAGTSNTTGSSASLISTAFEAISPHSGFGAGENLSSTTAAPIIQPSQPLYDALISTNQKGSQSGGSKVQSTATSVIEMSPVGNTVTVNVDLISGIDTTGSTDVTGLINNENLTALSLHPGASIVDNFGSPSDTYDIQGEVTLYSNMTVDGNGATIVTDPKGDWQTSVGQFVNQDATPNANTPQGAPINTNISVKGLVFYYPQPVWNVPIWIQNANGVDVQDNVFMAASNGQQFFINTQNAIVANNVSVGNINGALNGWGGLQNVAVTGNYVSNSGSAAGSAGAWFNGTQNPYGVLGGGMQAVYSAGNTVQGLLPGGTAIGWGPLQPGVSDGGFDIFGSMDALNGIPSTFGYLAGSSQNAYMAYNVVVGYVAGNPEETTLFDMSSNTTSGYPAASNDVMTGNLAYGSTRSFQDFQAVGNDITLLDNALVNGQAGDPAEYQPLVGTSGGTQGAVLGQTGQLAGGTMVGGPVMPSLELGGPLQMMDPSAGTISLSGLSLTDSAGTSAGTITMTASDIFGTLADGTLSGHTVSVSGDLAQVTQFLDALTYTPGSQGWDDAIHIQANQGIQPGSVWDIAVNVGTLGVSGSGTADYSLAASSFGYNPSSGEMALSGGESLTTLGGTTLVTGFDPVTATLSGTLYAAVVGEGGATITGTTLGQAGDISGIGYIDALLTGGGNDTITPGMAGATVDAATGNDLIQSNEGFVNATLGSGTDTVVLGLAGGDIIGGSGHDTIVNLPASGGPVNLTLGSGGGDVYLLSGDNKIQTTQGASSTFQFGVGATTLDSHGDDTIRAGAGTLDLTVSNGAIDFLMEGPGAVNVVGDGGSLLVDPLYTEQTISNGSTLAIAAMASPVQTFVASLDGVTGSFGEIGGTIFKNSTMTATSVVGSTALVNTDLTVSGSSVQAGTLSLDGMSTLSVQGSSQENIASIAAGAVLEGAGSIVSYANGTLQAGSATYDVSLPSGDGFEFSGGGNGMITATVVATVSSAMEPAGSSPVTFQDDSGTATTLGVDPSAASAIQSALNGAISATAHVATADLAGTIDLTIPPVLASDTSKEFLLIEGKSATGTIDLAPPSQTTLNGFAGEFVTGTGSLTLNGGSGSGSLLVLGAGTDVTWNGSDSTQNTVTVDGGGASNTLNAGGSFTNIFEGGGTNLIDLQSSAAVKDPVANIVTANDAIDTIQVSAGYATINSAGLDTISLTNRVENSTISMTGSMSSLDIGSHASNNTVTLAGDGETALIAGSKNTIYVDGTDTVTLTGSGNTVYDGNASATIVDRGHNNSIITTTTVSAATAFSGTTSMTFMYPQQDRTTGGASIGTSGRSATAGPPQLLSQLGAFDYGTMLPPNSEPTAPLAAGAYPTPTPRYAGLVRFTHHGLDGSPEAHLAGGLMMNIHHP